MCIPVAITAYFQVHKHVRTGNYHRTVLYTRTLLPNCSTTKLVSTVLVPVLHVNSFLVPVPLHVVVQKYVYIPVAVQL